MLKTARSTVDLSTQATGTLPVSNGGTGATSLASGGILVGNGTTALEPNATTFGWNGQTLIAKSATFAGLQLVETGASVNLLVRANTNSIEFSTPNGAPVVIGSGANTFRPNTDNLMSCGDAAFKFSEVFAGNGTINTSDAREKQQVRDLSAAERAVSLKAKKLLRAFKFNDAVDRKGDGARIHFGILAQELGEAFKSEGLNASDYSMFCYDEWEDIWEDVLEQVEVTDESGATMTREVPTGEKRKLLEAGNRYGVRYEQLLAFIIASI